MPTLSEDRAASQNRWEVHKETLQKLYLVEKKTLKEVGEFMAKSNSFKAT
jgi:Clr5 domain